MTREADDDGVAFDEGGQTLGDIRYQLIWVTRRGRPFLEGALLTRTVELLWQAADAIGVRVTRVVSGGDYLVVTIEAPPDVAPAMIVARLKRHSASALRREFDPLRTLPSIWTRRALVTTHEDFPESRVRAFVYRQPRNERRPTKPVPTRVAAYAAGPEIEVVTLPRPEPGELRIGAIVDDQ